MDSLKELVKLKRRYVDDTKMSSSRLPGRGIDSCG
jgi:hypothetical protein